MLLVTGGSSGIGKATVGLLRAFGQEVLAPSRGELDVCSSLAWRTYLEGIPTVITGLVNCAGISSESSVASLSRAEYEEVLRVNTTAVLLGIQETIPRMEAGGSIVNVASIFATHGGSGAATAYQMSKAALLALSRNVAIRFAHHVRVNTVLPGFVRGTRMTDGKGYEAYAHTAPMGRMLEPKEVAEVIAFLLSPRSSGMTGAEVYVDAGWHAR